MFKDYRNKISAVAFSLVAVVLLAGVTFSQISTAPGQVKAVNNLAPTAGAQMANAGGIVSNPSGLTIQASAATIFCGGAFADMGLVQLKGLANTSYQIVYNCATNKVYGKTAVVGPGSVGTSALNQPGNPALLLAPVPGVEIGLANVVCGASTCATITDIRIPAQFTNGGVVSNHLLTPLANSDAAFTVTLVANTATKTFTVPYQVAPVCVATDQTTAQLVKVVPSTTNVIVSDTVGATDVIAVACVGNPN